jgi:hypothetical protein
MKNIQNKITDNGVANGLDWSIVSIPSSLDYVQVAYSLVSINEGSTNVVKSGNITFTTIAELEDHYSRWHNSNFRNYRKNC